VPDLRLVVAVFRDILDDSLLDVSVFMTMVSTVVVPAITERGRGYQLAV
jgi:hypothetical protein